MTNDDLRNLLNKPGEYLFNLKRLSGARIPYWASLPMWSTRDAIRLSCNVDPRTSGKADQQYDPDLNSKIFEREEVVAAHVRAKTIPYVIWKDYDDRNIDVPEEFVRNSCMVKPDEFLKWADRIAWHLPEELCKAVAKVHGCLDLVNNKVECTAINSPKESVAADTPLTYGQPDVAYQFIQTERGWWLKFRDADLRGVKDKVGLRYIQILLQNPGEKMGVLKLQELVGQMGPEHVQEDYDFAEEDNVPSSGASAWEALDQRAIQEYRRKLEQIEEALSTYNYNDVTIDRLKKEKVAIEAQLRKANYRPKDPAIEKNRKRVLKNITDAISGIRKLEELSNYNDRPISSHLSRYIRTGAYCSYTATDENLPPWKF